MRGQALIVAGALLALASPSLASAQSYSGPGYSTVDPYCAQARQNRMLLGGAIGATVGAVLGNNVAARNAQTEGAVLGGVAGAATGAAIGRSTARCDRVYQQGSAPPPYRDSRDDYGLAGPPPSSSEDCRWATSTIRDPDGREARENVYMCRGRDGVWRRR